MNIFTIFYRKNHIALIVENTESIETLYSLYSVHMIAIMMKICEGLYIDKKQRIKTSLTQTCYYKF